VINNAKFQVGSLKMFIRMSN